MNSFDKILSETIFSSSETAKRMSARYSGEELASFLNSTKLEKAKLMNKYSNTSFSNNELMRMELQEYLINIVSLINEEYGDKIPQDRLQKLNNMCNSNGVVVVDDSEDKHDFSADSKNSKVIVNLAKIGKTQENTNPDIFTQIAWAKGILPHELFHIIINMLKPEELANERMIVELSNGETITSRGMVGFMLNEGFVEKFSSEFCEKKDLYHLIAPQYLPYIDVCNYIMDCNPKINSNTIFSLDASECINSLSIEDQQKYYQTEAISYAVRHKNKKAEDIKSSRVEKIEIDMEDMPQDRLIELQQYYNDKNDKLSKMLQIEKDEIHL